MHSHLAELKALADETRLAILAQLLRRSCCGGALARQLGLTEAAVSQHLHVLRQAGLIRSEKQGYWTHHHVEREAIGRLAAALGTMAATEPAPGPGCRRRREGAGGRVECCCPHAKERPPAGPVRPRSPGTSS